MRIETPKPADHFSSVSASYAQHRPTYPPEVAKSLAELVPARHLTLDAGCGTGQFSVLLAEHFDRVLATDASAEQLARAPQHARIHYVCETAEKMSARDGSVNLIVAAQAAHWFALPAFYAEARRIAAAGAVIALITYSVLAIDDDINERFQRFYWHEVGLYWPPERRHVEAGYADMEFPFEELKAPEATIERLWSLDAFLGYVRTWTATQQAERRGAGHLIVAFERDMATLWGNPDQKRRITWPIAMRIGRVWRQLK